MSEKQEPLPVTTAEQTLIEQNAAIILAGMFAVPDEAVRTEDAVERALQVHRRVKEVTVVPVPTGAIGTRTG